MKTSIDELENKFEKDSVKENVAGQNVGTKRRDRRSSCEEYASPIRLLQTLY